MFEIDFNVKFPLLRLLQFLSDLKRTIILKKKRGNHKDFGNFFTIIINVEMIKGIDRKRH